MKARPRSASPAPPKHCAGAPSISSTSTGVGTAIVSFTPGYSGGATISDYEYEINDSGTWTSTGSATSPLTITGLANATTYAIAIRAVTTSGSGAASADASVTTPGTPAAPIVGSIVTGDATLSIPFTAGATDGSTITSYQYQLVTSGPWTTASSSASPIVVTGLTNGATYQVGMRAINAVGTGTATAAQTAVPATVPGAPVIVGDTVAGSNHQLSAAFTAPASDGGSPIIGYDYSTDAGATWRTAGTTTSPHRDLGAVARRHNAAGQRRDVFRRTACHQRDRGRNGVRRRHGYRANSPVGAGHCQRDPRTVVARGDDDACFQRRRGDHRLRIPARFFGLGKHRHPRDHLLDRLSHERNPLWGDRARHQRAGAGSASGSTAGTPERHRPSRRSPASLEATGP